MEGTNQETVLRVCPSPGAPDRWDWEYSVNGVVRECGTASSRIVAEYAAAEAFNRPLYG